MGKRIIITEDERKDILRKYQLNEGLLTLGGYGLAAFFFYKFFQGLFRDPRFKRKILSPEAKKIHIDIVKEHLPTFLESFEEMYGYLDGYNHEDVMDMYHNEILPMLESEELIDIHDVMRYIERRFKKELDKEYDNYWRD